jgi:hypothetical protein
MMGKPACVLSTLAVPMRSPRRLKRLLSNRKA